jgi:hypothetical protein
MAMRKADPLKNEKMLKKNNILGKIFATSDYRQLSNTAKMSEISCRWTLWHESCCSFV